MENEYGEEKKKKGLWNKMLLDVKEAKSQVMFSVPMILTNVSYFSITLVSVMFAGHLGKSQLAASTLANSWASVTGFIIMIGLSGALETLCGQGYGAKMYKMLGIYLQSSIIITLFYSILASFIWFYSEPILILLHQEPQIAKTATIYLRHLIPGLFAYAILQCLVRFLQTQTVVLPLVICSVFPLVIHVGLTYSLVYHTVLGFKGAALSAAISLWLSVIMLGVYVHYSDKFKDTWNGVSKECFKYLIPNMKLAIPSAVMVCLQTEAVIFMISYGFSAAVSTRVANELGAGNTDRAKNAMAVTLKLSVFFALAIILFLVFGHNIWATAFSNNPDIKKEFASMTPLLIVSIFIDSIVAVLSGVSRGCGLQHLAAWSNLASYYVVGLPVAIVVGFKTWLHVKGLWIGSICGLFCQVSLLLLVTLRINWKKLNLSVNIENEMASSIV